MSQIYKFDINCPGARKLKDAIFDSIKSLWDADLKDDAVAEFTLALLSRGADRKRIHTNLVSVLQEETTKAFLDWLYKHLRVEGAKYNLTAAPPKPASKAAPAAGTTKPSPAKAQQAPAKPAPPTEPAVPKPTKKPASAPTPVKSAEDVFDHDAAQSIDDLLSDDPDLNDDLEPPSATGDEADAEPSKPSATPQDQVVSVSRQPAATDHSKPGAARTGRQQQEPQPSKDHQQQSKKDAGPSTFTVDKTRTAPNEATAPAPSAPEASTAAASERPSGRSRQPIVWVPSDPPPSKAKDEKAPQLPSKAAGSQPETGPSRAAGKPQPEDRPKASKASHAEAPQPQPPAEVTALSSAPAARQSPGDLRSSRGGTRGKPISSVVVVASEPEQDLGSRSRSRSRSRSPPGRQARQPKSPGNRRGAGGAPVDPLRPGSRLLFRNALLGAAGGAASGVAAGAGKARRVSGDKREDRPGVLSPGGEREERRLASGSNRGTGGAGRIAAGSLARALGREGPSHGKALQGRAAEGMSAAGAPEPKRSVFERIKMASSAGPSEEVVQQGPGHERQQQGPGRAGLGAPVAVPAAARKRAPPAELASLEATVGSPSKQGRVAGPSGRMVQSMGMPPGFGAGGGMPASPLPPGFAHPGAGVVMAAAGGPGMGHQVQGPSGPVLVVTGPGAPRQGGSLASRLVMSAGPGHVAAGRGRGAAAIPTRRPGSAVVVGSGAGAGTTGLQPVQPQAAAPGQPPPPLPAAAKAALLARTGGAGAAATAGAAAGGTGKQLSEEEAELLRVKQQLARMERELKMMKGGGGAAAPQQSFAPANPRLVVVSNLNRAATNEHVRKCFSDKGFEATNTAIQRDVSGLSTGTAVVELGVAESAVRAVTEMNGTKLLGMNIVVEPHRGFSVKTVARPRPAVAPGMANGRPQPQGQGGAPGSMVV